MVWPKRATRSAMGASTGGSLALVTEITKVVKLATDGPRASAASVATRRTA